MEPFQMDHTYTIGATPGFTLRGFPGRHPVRCRWGVVARGELLSAGVRRPNTREQIFRVRCEALHSRAPMVAGSPRTASALVTVAAGNTLQTVNDLSLGRIAAGRGVRLTNADKVLYPETGTTKADVRLLHEHRRRDAASHRRAACHPEALGPTVSTNLVLRKKQLGQVRHRNGFGATGSSTARHHHLPLIDSLRVLPGSRNRRHWRCMFPNGATHRPGNAGCRNAFGVRPRSGAGCGMVQLCEVAHAVREMLSDIGMTVYPSPVEAKACTSTFRSASRSAAPVPPYSHAVSRSSWSRACRSR